MQRWFKWIMQFANRCLVAGLIVYVAGILLFVWQVQKDLSSLDAQVQALVALKPPADGIVMLTGGAERIKAGLTCLQQGCAPRALISGVHHDVKIRELLVLHHFPKTLEKKIDLGFGAIDTAGNAQETAKWVKDNQVNHLIVVTSNYHMGRALLHLRAMLPLDVTMEPLSVKPDMLEKDQWYKDRQAWALLFLAYNKYLLTWPEMILWRYKK